MPMLVTSTVNDVRTITGDINGAIHLAPRTTPAIAGIPAKITALRSIGILRKRILKVAVPIPTL